jgi:hypothetical protein
MAVINGVETAVQLSAHSLTAQSGFYGDESNPAERPALIINDGRIAVEILADFGSIDDAIQGLTRVVASMAAHAELLRQRRDEAA